LRRFRLEAEAVAALQHPHIVQIYEIGEHENLPYFSLEYLDGGSLDRQLGTPWPAAPAARLVEILARAMHAAHQRGIVHRDLKPANILLQRPEVRSQKSAVSGQRSQAKRDGVGAADPCPLTSDLLPKITDFGLAKKLETPGQTQTGTVMGTP